MFESFVGVRVPSAGDKLAAVKESLKGSFYTAKLDTVMNRTEVVVKVPNSLDPITELQEYFHTRLVPFKVFAL